MRLFLAGLLCIFAVVVAYNSQDFNTLKIANSNLNAGIHVKQNFQATSMAAIRKQMTECYQASYQFLQMSYYFDRADVALPGFKKYFEEASKREMGRSNSLMKYMNKRGGDLKLPSIKSPDLEDWSDGIKALQKALSMAKNMNTKFLSMHNVATTQNDPHLKQYVEEEFLDQQVKLIKELADYITEMVKLNKDTNKGLGLFIFDKMLNN